MWTYRNSDHTAAPVAHLWEQYTAVDEWPLWDVSLRGAVLDGAFGSGGTGTLWPTRGRGTGFRIVHVVPFVSFMAVTDLPGARIYRAYRVGADAAGAGCRFTHTVTIVGVLSGLYGRRLGPGVAAALPVSMRTLALLTEEQAAKRPEGARPDGGPGGMPVPAMRGAPWGLPSGLARSASTGRC
ncbi:hypothetical protein [Yinghuangia seranimata]|uniref:hypothetical protein n=1 Tax=Yinghuangia seranimata TaxID=408067 RepID=UPI00248AA5CA|nr:hypothetical protein [Yinghuangia seranimata]MDI2130612.1 hypothetical protein [Yinghuangia seranimata]